MKLIKIEFLKLSQNKGIWVLLGVYFGLLIICLAGLQAIADNIIMNDAPPGSMPSIYQFPDSWQNMTWIASWFKIVPAIAIITLVGNEYTYKTMRAQLINGLSRTEIFLGKLYVILILGLFSTLLLFIVGMILGQVYSTNPTGAEMFQKAPFLIGYFVQIVGYMMFAYMLAVLLRKSGITIGLLLLYTFVEMIIDGLMPDAIEGFLPLDSFQELIQSPFNFMPGAVDNGFAWIQLIPSLIYCGVFSGVILLLLNKRDQ